MTTKEFSDLFDVLYNNITSNQAPGLNEYEKSVFLTKAQEEIVKNYFLAESNPKLLGFDDTSKRLADFSSLIREGLMTPLEGVGFDRRSTTKKFIYPPDVFLVLNEQINDSRYTYVVRPISYREYDRLMAKPYKFPPKYEAWRLITNKLNSNNSVTIVTPGYARYNMPQDWSDGTQYISYYNRDSDHNVNLWIDVENQLYPAANYVETYISGDTITIHCVVPTTMSFPTFKSTYLDGTSAIGYLSDLHLPDVDATLPSEMSTIKLYTNKQTSRVEVTQEENCPVVELIGRFATNLVYSVRYVRRPFPIILVNLSSAGDLLSINGKTIETLCELPEHLHDEILQRAVELAKIAWASDLEQIAATNMSVTSGQRSE